MPSQRRPGAGTRLADDAHELIVRVSVEQTRLQAAQLTLPEIGDSVRFNKQLFGRIARELDDLGLQMHKFLVGTPSSLEPCAPNATLPSALELKAAACCDAAHLVPPSGLDDGLSFSIPVGSATSNAIPAAVDPAAASSLSETRPSCHLFDKAWSASSELPSVERPPSSDGGDTRPAAPLPTPALPCTPAPRRQDSFRLLGAACEDDSARGAGTSSSLPRQAKPPVATPPRKELSDVDFSSPNSYLPPLPPFLRNTPAMSAPDAVSPAATRPSTPAPPACNSPQADALRPEPPLPRPLRTPGGDCERPAPPCAAEPLVTAPQSPVSTVLPTAAASGAQTADSTPGAALTVETGECSARASEEGLAGAERDAAPTIAAAATAADPAEKTLAQWVDAQPDGGRKAGEVRPEGLSAILKAVGTEEGFLAWLRADVIGRGLVITTPFGPRMITYADYTASGRMLGFVESFLQERVYPWYANVHTDVGACARKTQQFFSDARASIARAVNAPAPDYTVIFTGSGMTGAASKLAHLLGIAAKCGTPDRPVVFVGPYEHHSNEVLWRELDCELVVIPEDASGRIHLAELDRQLRRRADRRLRLGCFSAASNVTGIMTDVAAVARLLHRHGALAVFDYAAAAPYVPIDCLGHVDGRGGDSSLDAVMLSPHKLPGGPGSCGVLVIRTAAVRAKVPQIPGGGTVAVVTPEAHWFSECVAEREEGGTPNVIGAMRAALAFEIKGLVGANRVHAIDEALAMRAIGTWRRCDGLLLMGADRAAYHAAPRLSIISFNVLVRHPADDGRRIFLHPHFIAALLNDLYGIQARSGCSCAGPYGKALLRGPFDECLGFEEAHWRHLIGLAVEGKSWVKPGWVRVNLSHLMSPAEVDYIIQAVLDVARHAWTLLPQYALRERSGTFKHIRQACQQPISLQTELTNALQVRLAHAAAPPRRRDAPPPAPNCSPPHTSAPAAAAAPASGGSQEVAAPPATTQKCSPAAPPSPHAGVSVDRVLAAQLQAARVVYERAREQACSLRVREALAQGAPDVAACPVRWFLLPHEAAAAMASNRALGIGPRPHRASLLRDVTNFARDARCKVSRKADACGGRPTGRREGEARTDDARARLSACRTGQHGARPNGAGAAAGCERPAD